jgi:hypothetical protein
MDAMTLDTMNSYKVSLPSSLSVKKVDSCSSFCSNTSHTFEGLFKDTGCELLSNMVHWIFTNFRVCTSPEYYLVRATSANSSKYLSEDEEQRVVLGGVSNLKHGSAQISDRTFSYVDISTPG